MPNDFNDFKGLGVVFADRFVDISGLDLNADSLIDAIRQRFTTEALQTQGRIKTAQ